MKQYPPPKHAYSIKEFCHATSLSRSTAYRHIADGNLPTRKIGGRTVIMADALQAFLSGAN